MAMHTERDERWAESGGGESTAARLQGRWLNAVLAAMVVALVSPPLFSRLADAMPALALAGGLTLMVAHFELLPRLAVVTRTKRRRV